MTTALLTGTTPNAPTRTIDELGSRIVGTAGRIAAATCRWLLMVAEFDVREGYGHFGLASTAQWLSHACGITHRTAVEHVRVARALSGFPALAAALESGRISFSHARAISRLAAEDEHGVIDDLIAVAENGTVGQLETIVRGMRTVQDNAGTEFGAACGSDETGPHRAEYVRHGWASSTSHWRLSARLDPERGALVEHAMARVAGSEQITHADALVRLAEIALAALNLAASDPTAGSPPRGLRGHERAAVVIHLDAAAVRVPAPERVNTDTEAETDPGVKARSRERGRAPSTVPRRPFARIDGGPGLPRQVVERLLCACRIRMAVFDGTDVLDVGRTRRLVDDRTFRALLLRDRHCAFPGCTAQHRLEAHHVIHWLHGGRSEMSNLVLLCERHHHKHHDGEFAITRVGGRRSQLLEFRRADGQLLEPRLHPAHLVDPARPSVETEFAHVPSAATRSRADGDRLDRAWAVAVLAERRRDRAIRTRAEPTVRSDNDLTARPDVDQSVVGPGWGCDPWDRVA